MFPGTMCRFRHRGESSHCEVPVWCVLTYIQEYSYTLPKCSGLFLIKRICVVRFLGFLSKRSGFEAFVLSFNSSLSLAVCFGSLVMLMMVVSDFPFEESDGLMRLCYCKFLLC